MPRNMAPSLRLFHSPENVMLQANKLLSEGDPREAAKLYTEILYKLSPAHVPALLNRSLAYLCLRLPELAVYDAFRAGIIANQMREDANDGLTKYQATTKYLRSEGFAVDGGEEWTSDRNRFLLGGWGYSALSSIVINDVPQYEEPDVKSPRFSINKRQLVCLALEIRAIYRLAGALHMCGGGARSDALGLIDDAFRRCTGMEEWEKTYFQILGNEILNSCLKPWDEAPKDAPDVVYSSQTQRRRRDEGKRVIKENMLAKTTSMKHSPYPWDIHEPDLEDPEWQNLLESWVQQTTTNCSPHLIHDSPTPYIELRANRDIHLNEPLLSERTKSNVTTSIPEEILSSSPTSTAQKRYHCDTCAALLLIPHDATIAYKTPAAPSSSHAFSTRSTISISRDPSPSSPASNHTPLPHPSPTPPPPLPADTPSPLHPATTPPQFTLCAPTHPIPTCSPTCRALRAPYDTAPLHDTTLERDLRTSHLLPPAIPIPLGDRKHNCLVDLLFLRVFVNALATGMHPLQDRDLVFAGCGKPNSNSDEIDNRDARSEPSGIMKSFSFTANVVRPLWLLDRVFNSLAMDPYERLDFCDGWVLETLRVRIENAMVVEKKPGYTKIFDREGALVRAFSNQALGRGEGGDSAEGKGDEDEDVTMGDVNDNDNEKEISGEENSGSSNGDGDDGDEGVWSASIHPIFNLIRVADLEKGEKPNVRVVRDEGVVCFAGVEKIVEGEEGRVVIRKGEVLLRGR